jgi:hypothetical protein
MELALLISILASTVLFDEIFNGRLKLAKTLLKILDRQSSSDR